MKRLLRQLLDVAIIPLAEEGVGFLREWHLRLRSAGSPSAREVRRTPAAAPSAGDVASAEIDRAEALRQDSERREREAEAWRASEPTGPAIRLEGSCPRCNGKLAYAGPYRGDGEPCAPDGVWECLGVPDEEWARAMLAPTLHRRPSGEPHAGELAAMLREGCGWSGLERHRGKLWG